MQTLFVEFVVRTSLLAAAVALLLRGLKIRTAATRHGVWTAVLFVMLLLPAWLVWGPKVGLPLLPRSQPAPAVAGQLQVTDPNPVIAPLRVAPSTSPSAQPSRTNGPGWMTILYFLGVLVLIARLAVGTLRVRMLRRQAAETDGRLTHESCSTPVTVGWSHPSVILPPDWREWPSARLDAVLVHEEAHARRRDPLIQWIALLNRAFFWFHPLAWWLEKRLAALAEETCDVAVLERGHDPHDYSEYLLDLSKSVETAGVRISAGAMAMPGPGLPERIRRMLTAPIAPRISRARMAYATLACTAAAAVLTSGTLIHGQSEVGDLKFEVASVRPAQPFAGGGGGAGGARGGGGKGGGGSLRPRLEHGTLNFTSTVLDFIMRAYRLHGCGGIPAASCSTLENAPAWINKDRFEIQAKAPAGTPDYTLTQFEQGKAPEIQQMLKTLLADRFHLKTHQEQRVLPVYVLTQTKKSPNLRPGTGQMATLKDGTTTKLQLILFGPIGASVGLGGSRFTVGGSTLDKVDVDNLSVDFDWTTLSMTVRNNSIGEWIDTLSNMLGRPILDRSGLQGEFDMDLRYENEAPPAGPDERPNFATFSGAFFSTLNEQLGLKLESTKAEVPVLVIDHIDPPDAN